MADLDELRGGRHVEATGRLTLDRVSARAKLRAFRLPDPHFYVLQLVRAASALGAKEINFWFGLGKMSCEFDAVLPPELFNDFWAVAFEARGTAAAHAMHNIALGVGSAQALNPAEIRLKSGRQILTFSGDEEELFATADVGRTTFTMAEKFRFGHVVDFFTEHAEVNALKRYCEHALMTITINDEPLRPPNTGERKEFEARDERGWVGLVPSGPTSMRFLRDDVLVSTVTVATELYFALGVVNSRTLQTDLSGLRLSASGQLNQLLHGRLMGLYHALLLERLPVALPHRVRLFRELCWYLEELRDLGLTPTADTLKLRDWALGARIFEAAARSGTRHISARQATVDEAIVYSTKAYPYAELEGYPAVILTESREAQGLLGAIRNAGFSTLDVTQMLDDAAAGVRNRRIWEARPPLDPPSWEVRRTVTVAGITGYLYVPLKHVGSARSDQLAFELRVQGRMLRRVPLALPLGIVVDGELELNTRYSDVVRDPDFLRLGRALVAEVPALLAALNRYLCSHPQGAWTNAGREIYDHLLCLSAQGALSRELLTAIGYSPDLATKLAADLPNPDSPRGEILEWLDPIVDAPTIECLDGSRLSIRGLKDLTSKPIFLEKRPAHPPGHWDPGAVIVGSQFVKGIVRAIRPDSVDGDALLQAAVDLSGFEERALYEPPPVNALAVVTRTVEHNGDAAEIRAELGGFGDSSEVYLLYRGRLLAYREWSGHAGSCRVTVRCDTLTPTSDFVDVVEDGLMVFLRDAVAELVEEAVDGWAASMRKQEVLTDHDFERLWSVTQSQAAARPGEPLLPITRWEGSTWVRGYMPHREVLAEAAGQGGLLYVQRGSNPPTKPPEDPRSIVLLAPRIRFRPELFLAGIRLVELHDARFDATSRSTYLEKPVHSSRISGALHVWRGSSQGVDLKVGLFSTGFRELRDNRIDVVWEERLLEQIWASLPWGWFETVASSPACSPDPDYTFVKSHRAELLQAAQVGVAETVRSACRTLAGRPTGALGELAPLRLELLRFLSRWPSDDSQPPFDLWDSLSHTPLFDTSWDVRRISYADLATLAVEGVLPFSHHAVERKALVVDPDHLALVQAAVARDFALLPASSLEFLFDAAIDGPRYNNDALLQAIATLLVAARGDRIDLFDDAIAYGLSWDESIKAACVADTDGVRIKRSHPLVARCVEATGTRHVLRFLASTVYSEVNRYYRSITDHDELELQARLLTI